MRSLLLFSVFLFVNCNGARGTEKIPNKYTTVIIDAEITKPDTLIFYHRSYPLMPQVTYFNNEVVYKQLLNKTRMDTLSLDPTVVESISLAYANTMTYEIPLLPNDTISLIYHDNILKGSNTNNENSIAEIIDFVNAELPPNSFWINPDIFFDKSAQKYFVEKSDNYLPIFLEEKLVYTSLMDKLDSLKRLNDLTNLNFMILRKMVQSRFSSLIWNPHLSKYKESKDAVLFTVPDDNDPTAIYLESYIQYCIHELTNKNGDLIQVGTNRIPDFLRIFDQVSGDTISSVKIKNRLMFWAMEAIFEYYPAKECIQYFAKFKALAPIEAANHFENSQLWLQENPDNVQLAVYDLRGEKVNLSTLLNSDRIKYIDLWASWCGPCREEFQYTAELRKKWEHAVDFIFISVDKNSHQWATAVSEQAEIFGPLNFLLPIYPGQMNFLNVTIPEIPRYMIIGPQGKILFKTAPRPSNVKIHQALAQAVREKNN